MTSFANTIKYLRQDGGVTQKQLAQFVQVSQSVISNWEKGINEPAICHLPKLSQFFNVSIEYLIGITDEWGNTPTNAAENLSPDKSYILDLYEQMDDEHRENITATMELFVRNSKKSRLKKDG